MHPRDIMEAFYWIRYMFSGSDVSLNVGDSITVGGDTNYVEIDATNGVKLHGTTTCWDDLRFPMSAARVPATAGPDWVKVKDNGSSSVGVYAWAFDKTTDESLYFACQLPHSWAEGTDITAHCHWLPTDTDTGNVLWKLEYTWSNIDGTFGNTSQTDAGMIDAADGTAYKHQMTPESTISGTGKTHSSMMICRVFRFASGATDTYDNDAVLLEMDFHYQVDGFGDPTV